MPLEEPSFRLPPIDPKNVELFTNESARVVVMRITNMKSGQVESLVYFKADELGNFVKQVMTTASKIRAFGTHIVLPGDPGFKLN